MHRNLLFANAFLFKVFNLKGGVHAPWINSARIQGVTVDWQSCLIKKNDQNDNFMFDRRFYR